MEESAYFNSYRITLLRNDFMVCQKLKYSYSWVLKLIYHGQSLQNSSVFVVFLCQMYNVNIESWKSQYREILDEEQAGPSNESSPTGGIR